MQIQSSPSPSAGDIAEDFDAVRTARSSSLNDGFHPFHIICQYLPALRFVMQLMQEARINLERFGRSLQPLEILFGSFAGSDLIRIPVGEQDWEIDHWGAS